MVDVTQVVEVVASAGGVGGLLKGIQTATRIAAAVEALTERMEEVIGKQDDQQRKIQEHDVRLAKGGL
ncbi:MAG TPA: hypothetical protein VGG75_05705 [Trebonia sp.]